MEIILNGEPRATAAGTVAELLAELELADRPVAVELNTRLVTKSQHAAQQIAPGDRVEVVTLVGGG